MNGQAEGISLILIICACIGVTSARTNPPNIVFILADDLGWNDIGYHGSEIRTPVLDRLATEGVKLESYYVQPICTPSRSQLLTGRYQIHTGLQHSVLAEGQPSGLPLHLPTLPEVLRKHSYATHAVGKWHLGYFKKEYTPIYRGFQSFYGYFNGHITYFNLSTLGSVQCPRDDWGFDFRDGLDPLWEVRGNYSTHLYTKRAQKIISEHNKTQPLFLYLPYQNVHDPLEVPEKYTKPYQGTIKDPKRLLKAGMTSALDEAVGQVVKSLKSEGLWENTILIFSTDNGAPANGGSNYPLRGWKWSLWEGGMRGVAFVNSPLLTNQRRGSTVNHLLHISDWFPTILNLVGIPYEEYKTDGYDIWPVISQGAASKRKELLHNIDPFESHRGSSMFPDIFDTRVRAGIRSGDWKLMTGKLVGPGEEIEYYNPMKNIWLFNIREDPLETTELSDRYPDITRALLRKLQSYNTTAVPVWFPPEDPKACPHLHGGAWVPWM